jgi:serine protease AprX
VLHATFRPLQTVKRSDFAVIVTRTHDQWNMPTATANRSAGTTAASPAQQTEVIAAAPNPFKNQTVLTYNLAETGAVRLEVFNLLGQRVQTLRSEVQTAGWHEQTFDGTRLPAGVYVYKLTTGNKTASGRVVLTH